MSKYNPKYDIDPVNRFIGQRLRMAREISQFTLAQLSKELETSYQQIQKYERGLTSIPANRLWQYAIVLDKPISYFFDGLGHVNLATVPMLQPQSFTFHIGAYQLYIIAQYKG